MNFEVIKSEDTRLFYEPIENIFAFLSKITLSRLRPWASEQNLTLSCHAHYFNGHSSIELNSDKFQGKISLTLLLGGGFYLIRNYDDPNNSQVLHDIFNEDGSFAYSAQDPSLVSHSVDQIDFALCPFLNHLYNYLCSEYSQTTTGTARTTQVHKIESFFRSKSLQGIFETRKDLNDPIIKNNLNMITAIEIDPVLNWKERQLIFENKYTQIKEIIKVKSRAHGRSSLGLLVKLQVKSFLLFLKRIRLRPWQNLYGLINKYTWGKLVWFVNTVKDNLGYSVALAIYGPFTYYFITMPMNPHAMQAVGKLRNFYIETKESVVKTLKSPFQKDHKKDLPLKEMPHQMQHQQFNSSKFYILKPNESEQRAYQAKWLNFLPSTEVSETTLQSWEDRMSDFKNLQIDYEESLMFAPRMGRLEQLETQYNFPLIIEATWVELERYLVKLNKILTNQTLPLETKEYLQTELLRGQQIQLYLWDRLGRFVSDQPYVILNKDNEQKQGDYYLGRVFVFYQKISNTIFANFPDIKKHKETELIIQKSKSYQQQRIEKGEVLSNLKSNSRLFNSDDFLDSEKFRQNFKRQWEVLYLQNAKAEEAANNGLNMYIWSIRNTIWLLQGIYSAKENELEIIAKDQLTQDDKNELLKNNMIYETLFHNLVYEYVSIRKELSNLKNDIEYQQRVDIINNLMAFLNERNELLKAKEN